MNNTANKKKQTIANNELLRETKRIMNKATFSKVTAIVNEQGNDAGLSYLQQVFFLNGITIEDLKKI